MPNGIVIGLAPARGQCEAGFPLHLSAGAATHAAAPALALSARAPCRSSARRRALLIAAALSTLLHAATAGALFLQSPSAEQEGAGGENEGVSIELVQGAAIESAASPSTAQAAASAEVNADSGAENPQNQPEQQAADTAPQAQPPEPLPPLQPNAPDGEIAANPEPEPKPEPEPEKPPERAPPKTDDGKGQDATRQPAAQAQSAGGPASRGRSVASAATEASAGASAGRMSRYAASVHAALVKHRPRHSGASGRVKVLLSLSVSGEVTGAEISATSGSPALDRLALDAVHRVQFPTPPEGARERQLRYIVSIEFR